MNRRLRALLGRADRPAIHRHAPTHPLHPASTKCEPVDGEELRSRDQQGEPTSNGGEIVANDESATNVGSVPRKPPADARVEAHRRNRTLAAHEVRTNGAAERSGIAAASLQFDEQRHALVHELQHLRQRRDELIGSGETVSDQGCARRSLDFQVDAAHAVEVGVVKDDSGAVGGQPHVAFDPGVPPDGRRECSKAVLGTNWLAVQAPVREPRRPGVQRISV